MKVRYAELCCPSNELRISTHTKCRALLRPCSFSTEPTQHGLIKGGATVVLVQSLSASGSWGALLWLPTLIIKNICDTRSLALSHTHTTKTFVDLCICALSNLCVPGAVCLFFSYRSNNVHFKFVVCPFILFPTTLLS